MRIYTRMPASLRPFFDDELNHYILHLKNQRLQQAWRHLERAHIIGQRYPLAHSLVHWKMLQFGWKIKNFREVIGQLPRLAVGGVKSFVGKIPVGNPGGANVPPLQPYPIPEEISHIFEKAGVSNY